MPFPTGSSDPDARHYRCELVSQFLPDGRLSKVDPKIIGRCQEIDVRAGRCGEVCGRHRAVGDEHRRAAEIEVRGSGVEETPGQDLITGKAAVLGRVAHHQVEARGDLCRAVRGDHLAGNVVRGEIACAGGDRQQSVAAARSSTRAGRPRRARQEQEK
jgi:hypothetical protein